MSKIRGFELVTKYEGKGIIRPVRATKGSAGYDLAASKTVVIPSIWNILSTNAGVQAVSEGNIIEKDKSYVQSTLVPTGVKAYMPENEYLMLVNRSSNAMKNQLALPNGVGIIDADYYNNTKNEGEIFVQLINYGLTDYTIQKGDRIAQGIFMKYETVDEEEVITTSRTGGFGSSGK